MKKPDDMVGFCDADNSQPRFRRTKNQYLIPTNTNAKTHHIRKVTATTMSRGAHSGNLDNSVFYGALFAPLPLLQTLLSVKKLKMLIFFKEKQSEL